MMGKFFFDPRKAGTAPTARTAFLQPLQGDHQGLEMALPPEENSPDFLPSRLVLEKFLHRLDAYALYHYLDAHGLPVSISDPPLRAALGEIPFVEVVTEVWLEDPATLPQARKLMERRDKGLQGVRGAAWTCRGWSANAVKILLAPSFSALRRSVFIFMLSWAGTNKITPYGQSIVP